MVRTGCRMGRKAVSYIKLLWWILVRTKKPLLHNSHGHDNLVWVGWSTVLACVYAGIALCSIEV